MAAERILVAGGGVAGLAMMNALHREGILAEAVESRPRRESSGLAVNLPGNGVRALRALGVDVARDVVGAPVRRREYRTDTGRLLFSLAEDEYWGRDDTPRCVRRGDLLAALERGLAPAALRRGVAVTEVTETGDGVEVSFSDGSTGRYALVIGADGVRSAVRASMFGGEPARYAMLSADSWRFMTPDLAVTAWTVWFGDEATLLMIPAGAGSAYVFASATGGRAAGSDPAWLRTAFAAFPDPVPQAVAHGLANDSELYYSPIAEVRLRRWSQGHTVLIGDAAHATAPVWAQGASLAVEDALVLAEELAAGDDWSSVGERYEIRRRARVTHVQAMTDRLSRAAGMPGLLRNLVLPFVGPRSYRATYGPLRRPVVSTD